MRERTQQRRRATLGRGFLAVLAAVLAFFVVSGSAAWAGGSSATATSPAAAAVRALTADADAADATDLLPRDFGTVMGYRPVVVRSGGRAVLERASGGCSSPFGATRWDFATACRQHDLGYDLLRYADRSGHPLGAWARAAVDRAFDRHLHERCASAACAAAADGYARAVDLNSVRQLYRVPVVETSVRWALAGLAGATVLVLASWRRLRSQVAAGARSIGRRVRVSAPALLGAIGLGASLVPTILPRPLVVQTVLSAVVTVQLVAVAALVRRGLRAPTRAAATRWHRPAWLSMDVQRLGTAALALAAVVAGVLAGSARSAQLLTAMGQPAASVPHTALAAGLAAAVAAVVVAAARGVARGARLAWRSRRVRVALLVPVLAAGSTLAASAPHDAGSGIDVGGKGRRYLTHALTATQITQVTGRPARQPIRTYVGLDAAGGPRGRAALAVDRLDEAGGFDRAAVLVLMPTGSGWVDPAGVGAVEYLFGGDVASVAVQYDDVPSWIAYLKGSRAGRDTATALLAAIGGHVAAMPAGHRPQVLLFGESLGALAGLQAPLGRTDAALWVGVPGPARERAQQVATNPRQQVLLHRDDPVAAWSPQLAWRDTAQWHRRWVPVLSFWQGVGDLVSAYWTPDGYGHRYSSEMVDAWVRAAHPAVPGSPTPDRLPLVRAAVGALAGGG